jgi:hypothetical protein
LVKALAMKKKHSAVNAKFNDILPATLRQEWTEMISKWEKDKSNTNPYTHSEKGIFVTIPPLLHRANPV